MSNVLYTDKLCKIYNKKKANDEISLSIDQGDIYALIGKNGAGKTTFMKMITGLIRPTSGEVCLWGASVTHRWPAEHSTRIGAIIEQAGLMKGLSGYDNLRAKCICMGMDKAEYIDQLLEKVDLKNESGKAVKRYSLGMKQRLGIALALVGDPEFLVLDEPTNGLDPEGIAEIRLLIQELRMTGKTILISSHILEEVAKVATRYGFIDNGRLVKEISADELERSCRESGMSIEEYYFKLIETNMNGHNDKGEKHGC